MLVKKKLHKLKIRKYHNNSKNLYIKKTPASRGNKNMAELLATKGANSNIKNSDGKSALDFARIRGYGEIYEILRAQSFTFFDGRSSVCFKTCPWRNCLVKKLIH